MKKDQSLGLDELMIVNPGLPGAAGVFLGQDGQLYQIEGFDETPSLQGLAGQVFLGEDNTLYQIQGISDTGDSQSFGHFFLGDDGTLYQVQGLDENSLADGNLAEEGNLSSGHFFLGDDGTLYELVRS